jgi:hypothetical protein
MCTLAVGSEDNTIGPFMTVNHLHFGGFPYDPYHISLDHFLPELGSFIHVLGSVHPYFLVGRDYHKKRPFLGSMFYLRSREDRAAQGSFHIAGSSAVESAVSFYGFERAIKTGVPVIDWDDVGVS